MENQVKMKFKYLFGPVPSRRLGVSLGIDMVPYKTCTFECVYCECGRTTNLTKIRNPYVKGEDIIKELKQYLSSKPELDYITFSGGGEPTLNSDIGKIVEFLKKNYNYRVALLTNGSLFTQKQVRQEVKDCDLIIPSLDAASQEIFEKINRPCPDVKIDDIINGIKQMKREMSGEMWIEVFVVPEMNDTEKELEVLKKALKVINPDKVQLNTLDRPGTEQWVRTDSSDEMEKVKNYLKPLKTEIIGKFKTSVASKQRIGDMEDKIISVLERRPCTQKDLTRIFSIRPVALEKFLTDLKKRKKIVEIKKENKIFYRAKENE